MSWESWIRKNLPRIKKRENRSLFEIEERYKLVDDFEIEFIRPEPTYRAVSCPNISYANGSVSAPASETQKSQKDFKNPLIKNKEKDWEKFWGEKQRAIDLE